MPKPQAYKQIAETLLLVPAGRVVSYGQLADLAGLPGRARLVGRSLKLADLDVPLPWHRVVRADGKIAFPPGSFEAEDQRQRLCCEGVVVVNNRISMSDYCWLPDPYTLLHQLKY